MSEPSITEIHYYNLYQPTRAYHISDNLKKVKNIYSKEEKELIENKGSVKVKYELLDGTAIKDDADVVKDSVIESIETKYYLDNEGNKIIVSEVNTPKTVDYDATKLKLSEIISTSGKKYKLVGLKKTSSPEKGKVTLGTTVVTYVYKLANGGNVYEKYMLEGTETELADTKQLTKEAMIGDEYISNAPEVGMMIKKDGKTYIYKGHRSTSASEKGAVGENEKIVIYDFVEYFSEKGEPEVQHERPEGIVSEKGEPEIQPELLEGVVSEKGEPEVQPELPEGIVSEKGEPEIQPELPEGVVSEKGDPEVQPELPEGVVSEKGEPEVKPELPEGIVSEKGDPEVQPELPEGVVSEKGEPEVLEKPEFLYGKGDSTINEINKISEIQKAIENNNELFIKESEVMDKRVENIKGKTLPNTGSTSTETTTLGILALIGIEVARRKLKVK